MSSDALERLKKRQRPSVPSRDASLTSGVVDISISGYLDDDMAAQQPEPLLTKQSTLRLEAGLSDRLSEVCKANGISREVLIEALFAHYEADSPGWQAILTAAKQRASYRMRVANMRRAKSMVQRLSGLE
jgi:hypothetical protein